MTDDTARHINRREALAWLAGALWTPAHVSKHSPMEYPSSLFSASSASHGRGPDEITAYLQRLEGFGFAGAILVAQDGDVLVQSPHGLADQTSRRLWAADTIFDVGSCTKQFTATAILALEADGKLLVSDPVGRHLPGVPADKAGITVHHLLTHTAGLRSEAGGDYEVVSRDALVERVMEEALLSAPGERHAYSNVGYSLLAAIVEHVSGESIDRYLRERLFQRVEMTSSGYRLSPIELSRVAVGYRNGEDTRLLERAEATNGQMWNLIGNGGLYSTITDLHRWLRALQSDAVLPDSIRRKLFSPHALVSSSYSGSPLHYGYGWYIWKQSTGKTMIWHLGGNGITNTALRIHADDNAWVIYGSNVSEFHDPSYPVPAVERMLKGDTVELPPQVVSLTSEQLARRAGTYRGPGDVSLTLAVRRNFLEASGDGQEALSFVVEGEWQSTPAFNALNSRTAEVVEASRLRQFDVVGRFFGSWVTPQELIAGETAFWQRRHDRLGEYVGTRVVGTMRPDSRRYVGRTIVAIDFRRGTTWREYFWTAQGTVGDVGPIETPPTARFYPTAANCFVAFDPAAATSTTICIDSDVNILTIPTTAVTLRRQK